MNIVNMVWEFNKKMGVKMPSRPMFPSDEVRSLRKRLDGEEFLELSDAEDLDDLVEVADAIGDLIYTLIGRALCYGIPIDIVLEEIHKTNMRKDPSLKNADGKIIKPEGWQPPDINGILVEFGWEDESSD